MRNCGGMSLRGAGPMPIVASMSRIGGSVRVVAGGLVRRSAGAADGGRPWWQATGDRRQTAGSGRPGQQTEGRRWQTVGDLAGPPTQPADASDLPLQQHQRRKGAGYAARAAM